jgi:hypothetical protein
LPNTHGRLHPQARISIGRLPGELRELCLEDMLADLIFPLAMRRDGLIVADARLIMSAARAARRPLTRPILGSRQGRRRRKRRC